MPQYANKIPDYSRNGINLIKRQFMRGMDFSTIGKPHETWEYGKRVTHSNLETAEDIVGHAIECLEDFEKSLENVREVNGWNESPHEWHRKGKGEYKKGSTKILTPKTQEYWLERGWYDEFDLHEFIDQTWDFLKRKYPDAVKYYYDHKYDNYEPSDVE